MNVPLLDLKAQYQSIRKEVDAAVAEVFASQYFILGPQVKACEEAIARYSYCAHAVGVASGTDALLLALMAEGIGPGDEVITSPYTFFATAGSVARLGARPVFVDIDPSTFNLDVKRLEAAVTPRTKAIIPVHLYGQMADMDPIMELAGRRGLVVIEDACQSIGAEYKGRRAGSIGTYGCFSFFPSKNLGGAGDGGAMTTQDKVRADRLFMLRVHGMEPKYYHQIIGGNFRLDALQAAVVNVKMKYLDGWTAQRQANAALYDRLLTESGVVAPDRVQLPQVVANRHVFNQYVLRVPRRDELRAFLQARQIGVEVYYPVPLHLQACFAYLGQREGSFPESEKAARETLALPVYPELTEAQVAWVVESIAAFFKKI
jgi:dTDP-4-amino-4,6-dideoxygalactose transaminase